jgi:hypothetical protein
MISYFFTPRRLAPARGGHWAATRSVELAELCLQHELEGALVTQDIVRLYLFQALSNELPLKETAELLLGSLLCDFHPTDFLTLLCPLMKLQAASNLVGVIPS